MSTMNPDTTIRNFPGDAPAWFAVYVKATHEKRVTSLMSDQGYECLLPLYECRKRWSDRVKDVELPLFPGYVFSRFAASSRTPILKTPSVMGVVGIDGKPIPIEDHEIAALRLLLMSKVSVLPHPFLRAGRRVRIHGGALDGLEGVIEDVRHRRRLIVSVSLLQRSVAVEVDSGRVSLIHAGS
jgi:transcription antitermination factor NusG